MNCPDCGAESTGVGPCGNEFACGSSSGCSGGPWFSGHPPKQSDRCKYVAGLIAIVERLQSKQPCGHPIQCVVGGEDEPDDGGTRFCQICALEAELAPYRAAEARPGNRICPDCNRGNQKRGRVTSAKVIGSECKTKGGSTI